MSYMIGKVAFSSFFSSLIKLNMSPDSGTAHIVPYSTSSIILACMSRGTVSTQLIIRCLGWSKSHKQDS